MAVFYELLHQLEGFLGGPFDEGEVFFHSRRQAGAFFEEGEVADDAGEGVVEVMI